MEKLVETSIRLSPGTLNRLRTLAHLRSIEAGRNISWNKMVRDVVEKHLLGGETSGGGVGTQAAAGR